MASREREFGTAISLERYLNRQVLFIQGIPADVPKAEVVQVLSQVMKQPQQGRIDILTTNDGKMRGTAFLNFHIQEEAKAALDKWRFCLELRGRPLRMQYSSDREFKDILQGPMMARFKILIRNLPEEITQEALYEMFSQYGEVIQVHSNCDHYGQHYAIVQYLDVSSVQSAIRNAHRQKVLSHVLLVESYKPNQTYGVLPRNINQLTQPPPQAAAAPAAPPPPAGAANGGGAAAAAASLPGTTYAALQQQEQRELEEAERQAAAAAAAAAERYPGSSGGGGGAVGTSNGGAMAAAAAPDAAASMAMPSFYAAAAAAGSSLAGPTAPGSLAHLLASALRHAQALEEHLCCPITQEPLRDPVVAADGNTYERLAIEAWLQQHDTSPMTNEILPHKALTPNNLIRKIAEEILKGGANTPDNNDAGAAAASATAPLSAPTELMEPPPAAAAAAVDGPAAAAAVPVPVPVPVPTPAPPPHRPQPHSYQQPQQPQLVSTSQPQQQQPQTYHHHHQQHQQQPQQQQYADYGHHHHHAPPPPPQHQHQVHQQPQVLGGPQLVAAPLTFVHTLQPQQPHFQMQGTTYYTTYRPMGL